MNKGLMMVLSLQASLSECFQFDGSPFNSCYKMLNGTHEVFGRRLKEAEKRTIFQDSGERCI
jgi:hypothetical protein